MRWGHDLSRGGLQAGAPGQRRRGIDMTMQVDLSKFRAALVAVKNQTKKPEADIVNRAMRDVAFRSASFTPKATASSVRAALTNQNVSLLASLAAIACNKKFGVKKWSRVQHKEMMGRVLTRRKAGLGALRAGWIPAIQALGGSYRGAKLRAGSASKGTAKKATINNLFGTIKNTVITKNYKGEEQGVGSINIAVDALGKAIRFVINDRQTYLDRKRGIVTVLKANSDK